MFTFKVDDVKSYQEMVLHGASDKRTEQFIKQGLACAGIKGDTVEAYKFNTESPIEFFDARLNGFVYTSLRAFDQHRPITYSPEDIWLVVAQAVGKHIELFPEESRKAIVPFEGKKVLTVINADFQKGSPDNNWEGAFKDFGDQIEKHLGKKRDLFDPTFSETTPTEKAAIQVQMMAALAPYFEYRMMTCCGVPNITLLGSVEDWQGITERVQAFGEFYPKWAHGPLLEAVSQFELAARGTPDIEFWKNFFKNSSGSGATLVNGWINAFFPYIKNKPNKLMVGEGGFVATIHKGAYQGNDIGEFPSSVGGVPMQWDCWGTQYNMTLSAGIMGATIYGAGYRSVIGWAVGEAKEK